MFDIVMQVLMMIIIVGVMVEECLFFLHMFQLNGYKNNEYRTWLYKNRYVYLGKELPLILAVLFCLFSNVFAEMITILFLLCAAKTNRIRKKKKPLVYTKRVIRLIVTYMILQIILLVLFVVFGKLPLAVLLYACLVMLTPFVLLLTNLINQPIERGINNHYTNEAKRILAQREDLLVIGITGSYGKTSVKNFLRTILSGRYNVLMTPHNYNTPLGIVKTVRQELKPIHEVFICEMGARYTGDIWEDCEIAKPDMGIITSIGYQHLETFGSIENIIKTKYELARALPEGGQLFLNNDNEFIRDNSKHYASHCAVTTYGMQDAQFQPYDVALSQKGTTFKMDFPTKDGVQTVSFTTRLIGNHNTLNVAAAIAVAYTLKVPIPVIEMQVRKIEPVEHRLQIVSATKNRILIDDAYNSNPLGARQAVEVLGLFDGMKILVTPGMVELGEREYELNKEFAVQAAAICDRIVVVGKKRARPFEDGVTEAGYDVNHFHVAVNLKEAMGYVNNIQSNVCKVILLENDLPDNY